MEGQFPEEGSFKVSPDVAVLLFSILKYWLHLRGNARDSPSGTIAGLNARFCRDPQLHRPRHRNIFGFSTSRLFYSEQNCTLVCFYANVIFLCVLHISLLTCNHN